MALNPESRKYVTITTHQGLYQYTRLPFGIASASALFQRTMDSILQGIPHVQFYIDDILVTGQNDDEHIASLEEVLKRLQKHGVKINRKKCSFLQDSVEYLGHLIDKEGLHTIPNKIVQSLTVSLHYGPVVDFTTLHPFDFDRNLFNFLFVSFLLFSEVQFNIMNVLSRLCFHH